VLLDTYRWAARLRVATPLADGNTLRTRRYRMRDHPVGVQHRNGFTGAGSRPNAMR